MCQPPPQELSYNQALSPKEMDIMHNDLSMTKILTYAYRSIKHEICLVNPDIIKF